MSEESGLSVDRLTVRFGGLVAVDAVSFTAPCGRLTGLIGPNGAGKSTTFNACSGLVKPTAGTVRLFDADITGLSPQARARRGLGRTFQQIQLLESLTVRANVALGWEARAAGGSLWRQVRASAAETRDCDAATEAALLLCGITGLAERRPADLSTGQRREVELARAVAGGYRMLLLDEPSSGLDKSETARFGAVLRSLVAQGRGILLVEHDMSLVMSVCEYIYVLDFGKPLFEGTVQDVARSAVVRAAYLGAEDVEATA